MTRLIHRRSFLALVGSAAAAWPLGAGAQQPMLPVVGFLRANFPDTDSPLMVAFRRGLRDVGYENGRNILIEYRWAENQLDRLPELAADLIRARASVIATNTTIGVSALKAAGPTIPIVFVVGVDPVESGLVASLNRPGGNVTGVSLLSTAAVGKRIDLLHKLVPTAQSLAFLVNPTNGPGTRAQTVEAEGAARTLGLRLLVLNASDKREIEAAFTTLVAQGAHVLLVSDDPLFFDGGRDQIIELAAKHAVPTIYQYPDIAAAGGLICYGTNRVDANHLLGVFVGRILKGEKPADLPVQQATRFTLAINLRTAKALGLDIPPGVLAIVDEVIE